MRYSIEWVAAAGWLWCGGQNIKGENGKIDNTQNKIKKKNNRRISHNHRIDIITANDIQILFQIQIQIEWL